MRSPNVDGVHHVSLSVSDIERSAVFYERLLDLEIVMHEATEGREARVYRLAGTDTMLGLVAHADNDGTAFRPERTGLDHVAFTLADREVVDDWVTHLDELGIPHSDPVEVPPGVIMNFRDPDGIQLSVFWNRG